ncbi:MAG: hypothetical protein PHT33_10755, partial [bacterium]|nr:hypothetical protein [bacterium]
PLTINEAITNSGSGDIVLVAGTSSAADDITINADISSTGATGNIRISAADSVDQNADILVGGNGNITATAEAGSIALLADAVMTVGGTGNIGLTAGSDITLGADILVGVNSNGNISLDAGNDIALAERATVVTGTGDINLTAGNDIGLGEDAVVVTAGAGNIGFTATAGSVALGSGARASVGTDGNIDFTAGQDITLGNNAFTGVQGNGNIDFTAGQDITLGNNAFTGVQGNGDIDFTAGQDITLGSNAFTGVQGSGDIDLTADAGSITLGTFSNVGVGTDGDITLNAGQNIEQGQSALVSVAGNGNITATAETGSIALLADAGMTVGGNGNIGFTAGRDIAMAAGSKAMTAAGDVSYTAGDSIAVNEIVTNNGDVYLTASTGAITATDTTVVNVTAGNLTAIASSGIGTLTDALQTNVATLSGRTTSAGPVVINEVDGIELIDVTSANGPIAVTAGGTITAVNVVSETDSDANDITLTATGGGSIIIDNIDAGQDSGDVMLTADTGNGTVVTNVGGRVTGDELRVAAASGIDLTTTANSADMSVTGSGNLTINELDAVRLADISTADGYITVTAGGTITAESVASVTDSDDNDITLVADNGDVIVDLVKAGDGMQADVDITAGGAILRAGNGNSDVNITGDDITLNAATGIGNAAGGPLDIAAVSLVAGTTAGDINLIEADGIIVDQVAALDGSIRLITEATGSGDTVIYDMIAQGDGGNITVLSQDNGTVTVGRVTADGDVELSAFNGTIHDDNDNRTLITANALTLTAAYGIGNAGAEATRALDTSVNTLSASLTAGGAINIAEADGIEVEQAVTPDGDITITVADGNLGIGTITAATAGNTVTLIAGGGAVSDADADGLVNITASNLAIAAAKGIGAASDPLEVAVDNLVAAGGSGGIYIRDLNCGLNIGGVTPGLGLADINGLQTTGGDIAIAARGALTVNEEVVNTGTGDIVLLTDYCGTNGSITINAGITASGGNIALLAADSVDQNADIVTNGYGDVRILAESGSIRMAPGTTTRVQNGNIHYRAAGDLTLSDLVMEIGGSGAVILDAGGNIAASDETASIIANLIVMNSPASESYLVDLISGLIGDDIRYQIVINDRIIGGTVIDSNALLPLSSIANALDPGGYNAIVNDLWIMSMLEEVIDSGFLFQYDPQAEIWYLGLLQDEAEAYETRAAEPSAALPDAA